MPIPLQAEIVYGPLDSRRFGKSLGINLLPTDRKVCNFDCVYCQYAETKGGSKTAFPSVACLRKEFEQFLHRRESERFMNKDLRVDWIMIAGNGEPTLH